MSQATPHEGLCYGPGWSGRGTSYSYHVSHTRFVLTISLVDDPSWGPRQEGQRRRSRRLMCVHWIQLWGYVSFSIFLLFRPLIDAFATNSMVTGCGRHLVDGKHRLRTRAKDVVREIDRNERHDVPCSKMRFRKERKKEETRDVVKIWINLWKCVEFGWR